MRLYSEIKDLFIFARMKKSFQTYFCLWLWMRGWCQAAMQQNYPMRYLSVACPHVCPTHPVFFSKNNFLCFLSQEIQKEGFHQLNDPSKENFNLPKGQVAAQNGQVSVDKLPVVFHTDFGMLSKLLQNIRWTSFYLFRKLKKCQGRRAKLLFSWT